MDKSDVTQYSVIILTRILEPQREPESQDLPPLPTGSYTFVLSRMCMHSRRPGVATSDPPLSDRVAEVGLLLV